MKVSFSKLACVVLVLSLAGATPATAQQTDAQAAVRLPVTGSFARGGVFVGTISINRVEQRGNQIIAIGFVSGVLNRGWRTLGTALAGEVVWPVAVSAGGISLARGGAPETAQFTQIAWRPNASPAPRILRVQAVSCPVLNVALGATSVSLMGIQVALSPVNFDLGGVEGTPLGDLVCSVLDLLGNVAGLVDLLNGILGLLTGLLGGLVGGLGGALP